VNPFAPIERLAKAIADAEGSLPAKARAVSEHYPRGDDFDNLALASITDPGGLAVAMAGLELADSPRAREMKQLLRARATILRKEQAATAGLSVVSGDDVSPDSVGLPDGYPALEVPPGYRVDSSGVYKEVKAADGSINLAQLTHAPLLITARYADVDTQEEQARISWLRDHMWRDKIVPRSMLASSRSIVDLSSVGAPVHDGVARACVGYLAAQEAANTEAMPAGETTTHMGWVGEDSNAFLVGATPITDGPPRDLKLHGGESTDRQAKSYHRSGTLKGWSDALDTISEYPLAYAAVYAAIAPVFLRVINCPSFVIDWSCNTTRGKTTTLRVAASSWGPPTDTGGLIHSWLSTPTWIERTAAANCDLPLLLDDTNKIPARFRSGLAQTIYAIASGEGKGRGSISRTQATSQWRTIVLSTGENMITNYTEDAGTRARVLCLSGYPLGKHGAERAERLEDDLGAHYGHAGPEVVRMLLEARSTWPAIREIYKGHLARYADAAPSVIARRVAKYVALLDTVAGMVHHPDWLNVPRPAKDPIAHVWANVCETTGDSDRQAEALRAIYEAAATRPTSFYGRHSIDNQGGAMQPHQGWLGAWEPESTKAPWAYIAWVPSKLRRALEDAGHAPGSILAEWKARGWLDCDSDSNTRKIRIDGSRIRCHVIPRSAFESAGIL